MSNLAPQNLRVGEVEESVGRPDRSGPAPGSGRDGRSPDELTAAPTLTWRDLDDDVLRELHTNHVSGTWQVSDRVSTEGGRIIIDGSEADEPWADEHVSYAETALNVARWHREAVLVMNYPDAAQLALAVREIETCELHRLAVAV